VQHWKEGGHDQLCKPIKKAGGAEQYNANSRYSEAVAVAVEKCAEDTKGQTCFICTEALHLKTKEGLVRGCACRGTAGFAHVSCLAEQAKLLFEEAEYNNLDVKVMQARWSRWHTCSLCEQMYHGVVMHALGWACWKTYLGRPETDQARVLAMSVLGNGLSIAEHHEDALSVKEAQLSMKRRLGVPQGSILVAQSNIATTYRKLGQLERALQMQRDVYSGWVKLHGEENDETLLAALNYADALTSLERFEEAKALLRRTVPVARRVLGENHEDTLRLKWIYATALCRDDGATLAELREAVTTLEAVEQNIQRVFGRAHPLTGGIGGDLRNARAALAARDVEALGDALGALGAA